MGRKVIVTAVLAAGAAAAASLIATAGGAGAAPAAGPSWCGPKKITIALTDGFGGNTWRRITRAEAENEAKKCSSVTKFLYADGQGNVQKAISDINGLVAQGVNALIVFPDAGKAVLPAIRGAYKAGVVTVPYRVTPGGKPGVDYDYFVPTDFFNDGVLWAKRIVKVLKGKGNIVYLGGPSANSESKAKYDGIASVVKKYPGIKFVGQTPFEVTNWDPALTQKVVTALLAKYPKIDAIFADYGAALVSSFPAFNTAKRQIPPIGTEDSNGVACTWVKLHKKQPNFQIVTVSSQNWHVRTAVDVAVAKASGGKIPAKKSVTNYIFDDSAAGKVHCDPSLPPDAFLSTHLTKPQLRAVLK
jgi:ribose transport system substrate-binding protein